MFSAGGRKPYTAITQYIERLTGPEYDENDLTGIIDLIEVIRIQDTGPTEAARAIRKKLKYGSTDRQLRALSILDSLISNAGARFQRSFIDEPLLERLRILPRDDMVDIDVRKQCNELYKQWAVAYKDVRGLEQIATLYKQLPSRAKPVASQSRVIRETEQEAAEDALAATGRDTPTPVSGTGHRRNISQSAVQSTESSSSAQPRRASHAALAQTSTPSPRSSSPSHSSGFLLGHSRKSSKNTTKSKPFNLEKEKSNMLQTIAGASVASTNLTNALKLINRESQRVSDDTACKQRFEQCKLLRRQILKYIQLVESDQWIGSLLTANDELVNALMTYEVMDKSVDDDSDSDAEAGAGGHAATGPTHTPLPSDASVSIPPRKASLAYDMGGLKLSEHQPPAKPPRPAVAPAAVGAGVATPLALGANGTARGGGGGGGSGSGSGKARRVEDSDEEPENDPDENDPFGDQNEIR